jgi:hypothetical protein
MKRDARQNEKNTAFLAGSLFIFGRLYFVSALYKSLGFIKIMKYFK